MSNAMANIQHATNKILSILTKLLMTIFNKKMNTKFIIKKNPNKIELFGFSHSVVHMADT
jgi:hypothetical protein